MEKYHGCGRDVDEVRLLWAALQEYIQEALLVVLRCLYMASEPLIFNECNAFHHKLRHFASVKIVLLCHNTNHDHLRFLERNDVVDLKFSLNLSGCSFRANPRLRS